MSDFAERVTRKNSNNETDLPLTISSKDGLVDQISYFNKTVASKDMSGYYLLRNGEYAYNKSYSVGYDFGSIKRLDRYPMGALSTLYISSSPILEDHLLVASLSSFLFYHSKCPKYRTYFRFNCKTTSPSSVISICVVFRYFAMNCFFSDELISMRVAFKAALNISLILSLTVWSI